MGITGGEKGVSKGAGAGGSSGADVAPCPVASWYLGRVLRLTSVPGGSGYRLEPVVTLIKHEVWSVVKVHMQVTTHSDIKGNKA